MESEKNRYYVDLNYISQKNGETKTQHLWGVSIQSFFILGIYVHRMKEEKEKKNLAKKAVISN